MTKPFSPPVSYEEADKRAEELLKRLSIDEKISFLGGHSRFFIRALPQHGIPALFMVDATQGVRLDDRVTDKSIVQELEKTVAFPSIIMLTATWNTQMVEDYAIAVGEECVAAGAAFMLGPGMNVYRNSQCGRNFEYMGEDPYLISRMTEKYVAGMQSTGTAATLKHFICNNTDFYRRRSNSVVGERALNEIYMPAFKAGIEAGAMAVMTGYNKVNGEWCGQSSYLINELLRKQLGFKWLVMTDWVAVYDAGKVISSGQDLEMPELDALKDAKTALQEGRVTEAQIDRMVKSIMRTCIAMGFYDRKIQDLKLLEKLPEHVEFCKKVAREGMVLLKNQNLLPLKEAEKKKIVILGKFAGANAHGSGAANTAGYDTVTLSKAFVAEFGNKARLIHTGDERSIREADLVVLSVGTMDSEAVDRSFDLPRDQENLINWVCGLNRNILIVINSGGGINMSPWIDKVPAVMHAWYGGQAGMSAVPEIISGKVNPSGKLPISIEKDFRDSPAFGYLPADEKLYHERPVDNFIHREYDVHYDEGIFVGYRWYEHKKLAPLFPFGFGLSYSRFSYSSLSLSDSEVSASGRIKVKFRLKNTSSHDGAEVPQLYVQDIESSHPRPVKELKGFTKVFLKAGEEKEISMEIKGSDLSYWNPDTKEWFPEPGDFTIMIGSSSADIHLAQRFTLK